MIRIVADDKIPFLRSVLEPFAEVVYLPGSKITNHLIKGADALLIRTLTKCDEKLLNDSSVKFIGTATIGFDHIDTRYCDNHSIRWINAPGCNASSVQQYIACALFAIAAKTGIALQDQTLGIAGVGHVGKLVEAFAHSIGMKVLLNDPPRDRIEGPGKFVSLEHLIQSSDITTLHVPLNKSGIDSTLHLINKDSFRMMKKNAWLINSARGEVIDTLALKEVVSSHNFPGLVLDVWENEPTIDPELMSFAYLATPHIAGYSSDGKAHGTSAIVRELSNFFNLPLNDWFPVDIPAPSHPGLTIDGKNRTVPDIIQEAVCHTYSISDDDRRFRAAPQTFEQQRGRYPVRREFSAYHIALRNVSPETIGLLKDIGFSVDPTISILHQPDD